jgi:hypothetical protein
MFIDSNNVKGTRSKIQYLEGTGNYCCAYTATKIPFMYSFSENCAVLVQIHIHVSVSDLYIPKIGPHVFCSRIGRSILGISHRHINLEIGTMAAQFLFFGNIRFGFSVLVHCSV